MQAYLDLGGLGFVTGGAGRPLDRVHDADALGDLLAPAGGRGRVRRHRGARGGRRERVVCACAGAGGAAPAGDARGHLAGICGAGRG